VKPLQVRDVAMSEDPGQLRRRITIAKRTRRKYRLVDTSKYFRFHFRNSPSADRSNACNSRRHNAVTRSQRRRRVSVTGRVCLHATTFVTLFTNNPNWFRYFRYTRTAENASAYRHPNGENLRTPSSHRRIGSTQSTLLTRHFCRKKYVRKKCPNFT